MASMRRNKGTSLVSESIHNNCSNDTNLSSTSTTSSMTSSSNNPISLNEAKVRNFLKRLQVLVKDIQRERDLSEPNLANINKMHEKIRKEEKMSSFTRKKLRSTYSSGIKEAENEIKYLREALDCINQIRTTQSEIRLLQQQTNTQNPHLESFNLNESSKKMRRGVLMSILQQAALTLPLWIGEIGQSAPPLCGRLPPEHNYVCKPGDKVAAIVKNSNLKKNNKQEETDNDDEEEEEEDENWILAEVIAYHANTGKYDVDDVDAEEGQERYTLGKKKIVPLPLWRANPFTDPDAIFPKDSFVLALYPQTTCFYRGIVSESPQTPLEDYAILFEDNTYPEGYSPPLNVPQLYVVSEPLTTNYHHKK